MAYRLTINRPRIIEAEWAQWRKDIKALWIRIKTTRLHVESYIRLIVGTITTAIMILIILLELTMVPVAMTQIRTTTYDNLDLVSIIFWAYPIIQMVCLFATSLGILGFCTAAVIKAFSKGAFHNNEELVERIRILSSRFQRGKERGAG